MRVRAIWSNFLRSQRAYSRACSLAAKGDHEKAVAIFDEVIAAKTGDWGACIQRALSLSETGEYAMAVESAKKAASLAQWNAVAYLFLGRIHYDHGHYDRALNALERCLELDASNGLAAAYKGLVFLAMTRMDRARDTLAAANIRSMNSSFQGRLIALCEARLAKHTGALSLEECLLRKEQEPADGRGRPRPQRRDQEIGRSRVAYYQCLATLRHPLNHNLREAARHMRAGNRLADWGASERSWQEYRRCLELAPNWHTVRSRLADGLLSAGQYTRAIRELKTLHEALPASVDVRSRLGVALYHTGNLAAAFEHLKAVALEAPHDYWSSYYCGMCAIGLDNQVQARYWFARACEVVNPRIADERLAEVFRIAESARGAHVKSQRDTRWSTRLG